MVQNKVVLASNNAGKVKEFSALFQPLGVELIPQAQLGVSEADEPFHTFVENALAKARHASKATGYPALADDSGISVRALNGMPGVYSARYAQMQGLEKSDAANNALLVEQLATQDDKRARYVAVLVYVRSADDPCPIICEGFWEGEIQAEAAGEHGFGYDPHFYLPEQGCTAAQLTPELKNSLSHRAKALALLVERLHHEVWNTSAC